MSAQSYRFVRAAIMKKLQPLLDGLKSKLHQPFYYYLERCQCIVTVVVPCLVIGAKNFSEQSI